MKILALQVKNRSLLLSTLLLVSGLLYATPLLGPVHGASVGVVCIVTTNTTSCPTSPPTVPGTVGTQLKVSVFIQNSNSLNGFDITLLADHTILKPSSADLTGSVLSSPFVLSNCIGGVGTGCNSTADTADTIRVAAVSFSLTAAPTTGLLFTAVYSVVAMSTGTPIGYLTGCSPSSVAGTNTCVTIANGSCCPVPETVETAIFSTPPAFSLAANPSTLTVSRASSSISTITVSSLNGFSGTVSITAVLTPVVHHGPTASLSTASVTVASGGASSVSLTVSAAQNSPKGSYVVTVTGTSGTQSVSIQVSVTVTQ